MVARRIVAALGSGARVPLPRVIAVALVVALGAIAHAQQLPEPPSQVDPAGVLVMPFDVTANHASFELVSRIGRSATGGAVRTHWVFWSADCRHLADVFISLTPRDTVVVDPTRLQGQVQVEDPPENRPQGPVVDLSGERGIAIVTAFDEQGVIAPEIAGAWTIGDTRTLASYGTDAAGVSRDGSLPGPELLAGGVAVQTFNPHLLEGSQAILIGVQASGGEVTPITRASDALGGAHVCCAATVSDNLEFGVSIPDVCFACATFAPITAALAADGESSLLPPQVDLASSGILQLSNCRSGNADGSVSPLGEGDAEQILIAYHGQVVGPFGVVLSGRYLVPRPH
jgi:hypothetical protein